MKKYFLYKIWTHWNSIIKHSKINAGYVFKKEILYCMYTL